KEMFMEYREKEKSVVTAQMLTKVVPEKDAIALVELKSRLSVKNPLIKTYFQAIAKYERVMAMVNLMITTAISKPSVDELPIPEELKGMAAQLLDVKKASELAKQLQQGKLPEGFKLPPGMKLPGKQP
ncbi:MAG TPA: YlbF family regulator, partial [Verrucomicrobiae bacterium]|nr:YlbF family regulator [Verrucomicrobiae bacterium]